MLNLNNYIMFAAASAVLAIAPGPDNIFVLTQSITSGRISGLIVTIGLCTGLIFHTAIVALGIAAIFSTSIIAFSILKYLGAVYLLYLSFLAFKSSSSKIRINTKSELSVFQLYKRGIIMNVTNPKVSIFFMAFLPQFTDPLKGSMPIQIISLGLIFIVITLIVFGSISQIAGLIGNWIIKSENRQRYLNKIAGTVFASLAVKLIFTTQK